MISVAPKAVIFDLDMTLVDSSALTGMRNQGYWSQAIAGIPSGIKPFASSVCPGLSAHELPARLAAAGYRVGIVTSSPRHYAEAVLAQLNVTPDAMVCGLEAGACKPDPAPIIRCVTLLGVPSSETVYVGDAEEDFAAAYHAKVGSIGAGWAPGASSLFRTAPDVRVVDPAALLNPADLPKMGYLAEVVAAGREPILHPGSALECGAPGVIALGRYYPLRTEEHLSSILSEAILDFKNNPQRASLFAAVVTWALAWIRAVNASLLTADYLVCVPRKPSQPTCRFDPVLNAVKVALAGQLPMPLPDALFAKNEVVDYKKLSPSERAVVISGVFGSKYTYNNKRVLILDDVFTFGGTLGDCARAVSLHSGVPAGLTFAVDQKGFGERECPLCGGTLRVTKNKNDGSRFWGCRNYWTTGCRYRENIQ